MQKKFSTKFIFEYTDLTRDEFNAIAFNVSRLHGPLLNCTVPDGAVQIKEYTTPWRGAPMEITLLVDGNIPIEVLNYITSDEICKSPIYDKAIRG